MRKVPVAALFLPLLFPIGSHCQQDAPTKAQFTATLRSVVSSEPQWRKTIELVNIEDLQVEYALGKTLESNKGLVLEDLKIAVVWAARMQKDPGLYAEVNFLSAIQQLESETLLFTELLLEFDMRGAAQKKVTDWATAMSALANGPVNDAFNISVAYVTNHALLIEQRCPGEISKTKP